MWSTVLTRGFNLMRPLLASPTITTLMLTIAACWGTQQHGEGPQGPGAIQDASVSDSTQQSQDAIHRPALTGADPAAVIEANGLRSFVGKKVVVFDATTGLVNSICGSSATAGVPRWEAILQRQRKVMSCQTGAGAPPWLGCAVITPSGIGYTRLGLLFRVDTSELVGVVVEETADSDPAGLAERLKELRSRVDATGC